jgi:putative addiction module killer protein
MIQNRHADNSIPTYLLHRRNGRKAFQDGLRDRSAFARITTRLERVELGNVGDHKNVGSGVFELRIHYGPGYRVYYAYSGNQIVLLLLGGDKTTQERDIETAIAYWKHYQENKTCDQ